MEDFIKVELPEIKTFKSLKKDEDPFLKFWSFLTEKLETDIQGFDVSSVKLTQKDYKQLEKLAKSWFKKQSYYGMLIESKFNSTFGFHMLNVAPSEFYPKEEQPESGFAYVKSDWKETQERNIELGY